MQTQNETLISLGHKYAIAMIDIDHFKKFNDTYGYKTGGANIPLAFAV